MKMKASTNNKKLNISINILPDKYRWHFLKFKYVVSILLTIVGVAATLLSYQIVVDSYAATDLLYEQSDLLASRVSTMVKVNTLRNSMQQTMNEYTSAITRNGIMLNDVIRLYEIEADFDVDVSKVEYYSSEIIVDVSAFDNTAGTSWDLWVDEVEAFAVALRDDERFRTVTYEDPNFAAGEFFVVEFIVMSTRLSSS